MKTLREYEEERKILSIKEKGYLLPCFNCEDFFDSDEICVLEDGEEAYLFCKDCVSKIFGDE